MYEGIKMSRLVWKNRLSIGIVSTRCSERILLHRKDGKGSSFEVGETHCSWKSNDYRRQREKTEWESSLCHLNMDIFLPTKTERWTQLSFLTLLQNPNSHALGFRRCFPPAVPCGNILPAVPSPAQNLASELHQLSPSRSYSSSQTQCHLLLLQHPFQNPIRSIGKINYTLSPGCQTPCKPFSSLFLPFLRTLSANRSQLLLCHCNMIINSFAPRPWTTALAHNCGLGCVYKLFCFILISLLSSSSVPAPLISYFLCVPLQEQKRSVVHTLRNTASAKNVIYNDWKAFFWLAFLGRFWCCCFSFQIHLWKLALKDYKSETVKKILL